jgi:hypothetical protein
VLIGARISGGDLTWREGYSNWPTSSISAERTFALGRIIDSSQRGRQTWEVFAREMKIKANNAILQQLLREKLEYIDKMAKPK